jgi:hypothetical protein
MLKIPDEWNLSTRAASVGAAIVEHREVATHDLALATDFGMEAEPVLAALFMSHSTTWVQNGDQHALQEAKGLVGAWTDLSFEADRTRLAPDG